MKTFKQFQEEAQQLDEIAPLALIPAALKLGGAALTAYSAGSAINNLRKGKFKQAGLDALGAIPGGKVFKAAKFLGAGKNVARAASGLQSAARWNMTGLTPNAYAKGADKVIDKATKAVTGIGKGNKSNKPNQPGVGARNNSTSTKTNTKNDKPKVTKYTTGTTTFKLGGKQKDKKSTDF